MAELPVRIMPDYADDAHSGMEGDLTFRFQAEHLKDQVCETTPIIFFAHVFFFFNTFSPTLW